jgi:hypothetical protein
MWFALTHFRRGRENLKILVDSVRRQRYNGMKQYRKNHLATLNREQGQIQLPPQPMLTDLDESVLEHFQSLQFLSLQSFLCALQLFFL